ncbi:MAG: hypothetical protein RLZZ543_780 [Bacteroidota bacterium]|jgi:hypothetical protein
MKKVLVAVAVVAFFASCKKDYTCTCEVLGVSTTVDYNDLNKSDADAAETACTASSICKWAEK